MGIGQFRQTTSLRGDWFHRRPEPADCRRLSLSRQTSLSWTLQRDAQRLAVKREIIAPILWFSKTVLLRWFSVGVVAACGACLHVARIHRHARVQAAAHWLEAQSARDQPLCCSSPEPPEKAVTEVPGPLSPCVE